MSSLRYLALAKETVFGTYPTSPTLVWIRLTNDNPFTMLPGKSPYYIRDSSFRNEKVQEIANRTTFDGSLTFPLYPTQALAIFDWAATLNGSYDLDSYSIRHFDGTGYWEYNGVKVKSLKGSCASDSNEGMLSLTLDLVASKKSVSDPTSGTFSAPTAASFPSELPYNFFETAGGVTLRSGAGTALTKYKSLDFSINNILSPNFDELPYVQDIEYRGRDMEMSADVRYVSKTLRNNYTNRDDMNASIIFTRAGSPARILTLNFGGKAKLSGAERDLSMDRSDYEKLTITPLIDSASPLSGKSFLHTYVDT